MKRITRIAENNITQRLHKKLRVAAYCRVSTDSEEQLDSLEAQKKHYEVYIKANPDWWYAGIYVDEGISGTKKEKRPALLQLMTDCRRKKVDFIVTKSISRFARNTTDCLELVRQLLGMGVYIYFEKENLNTGAMENELMLSILGGLAENESVSISQNAKWSIQRRFRKGTFVVSYPPYGYKNIDGRMVVDDEQAKVVRVMFAEMLSGKSPGDIAAELMARGVPAKRGGRWTSTTIRGILTNEKYVGDALCQKTYTDSRFNRHSNHGEMDQYLVEHHHEPIVSREDFEAAGQLIRQRAKEKGVVKGAEKYQNRYPFSGRIICGQCGSKFKRRIHSSSCIHYAAWCCSRHIDDISQCSMQYIREDGLERAFVMMMNKLAFGRNKILKPLYDTLRFQNQACGFDRANEWKSRLEKNMEHRQVLTELMAKGYLEPKLFRQENNALLAETEKMHAEKENLSQAINNETAKADEVGKLLKFVGKMGRFTAFDGDVFSEYVERIIACSRTEACFQMKCGLLLKERV